jgi:glycosyltransferase involved in cell wall biosynthesis
VKGPWLVLRGSAMRWGGDVRRRFIFDAFIRETGARVIESWRPADIAAALGAPRPIWRRKPYVASSEMLAARAIHIVRSEGRAFIVDVHDEPIAAATALGLPPDESAARSRRNTWAANLDLFPNLVVPTRAFGELLRLDPSRTIVAANGTDTSHIRPAPLPDEPVIGMTSGAGPRRGIELLVDAARLVRQRIPEVRLALWLVGTSAGSQRYLDDLKERLASEPWILVGTASYRRLPLSLARASVLCIPHPPDPYFDVALPVKLADAMAAARPVVVTPRQETAAVVRRHRAGLVAAGDRAEDFAAALMQLLSDRALGVRLGANARKAAEEHFDWAVIGGQLARHVSARL